MYTFDLLIHKFSLLFGACFTVFVWCVDIRNLYLYQIKISNDAKKYTNWTCLCRRYIYYSKYVIRLYISQHIATYVYYTTTRMGKNKYISMFLRHEGHYQFVFVEYIILASVRSLHYQKTSPTIRVHCANHACIRAIRTQSVYTEYIYLLDNVSVCTTRKVCKFCQYMRYSGCAPSSHHTKRPRLSNHQKDILLNTVSCNFVMLSFIIIINVLYSI